MSISLRRSQNILLIQDDPADAKAVREALINASDASFQVEWVRSYAEGLASLTSKEKLRTESITAVLVDLFLPDSKGIETFDRLFAVVPQIPILILSALQDEDIAKLAVQHGAQDYLLKERLDNYLLPKALRNMIERAANAEALFVEKERAQVTLNSIGDGVISTDAGCRMTYLNAVAEKITGWSQEEAEGHSFEEVFQIIDATTREATLNPMALAIQRNKIVALTLNCVLIRRDGVETPIEDSTAPIHDARGWVTGAVMVFHDATTSRTLSLRMQQAQKMEAVGNLTGGMAHDFNNLLTVIIGNLDMLAERPENSDETKRLSQEALEAALRGADLTRRLLAFARQQPLQPQRVDVNKLVEGITKLLSRTLGEDVPISLDFGADIWPIIVDPVQLESALTNLATNARDAMPRGGKLTVTTANAHLDANYASRNIEVLPGDYVVLKVSDTGTGMPPEILAHIFEPFYTTKERGKGTGLGLAMVFGFMKQSGGHINVHSEINSGTAFCLYLPRAIANVVSIVQAPLVSPAIADHETILVVEDNSDVRQIVTRQLVGLGYHVLEVDNAAKALELLTFGNKVDLLFTDIVMPGKLNGLELARVAKERWPDLKVILTSGFPETKPDGQGIATSGLRLLSKPYRKADLACLIRETLDGVAPENHSPVWSQTKTEQVTPLIIQPPS